MLPTLTNIFAPSSSSLVKIYGGKFIVSSPNGPLTSTAEFAVSGLRLRPFDFGRSKNLKLTSGGIEIAVPPTRDLRVREDEKCRRELD